MFVPCCFLAALVTEMMAHFHAQIMAENTVNIKENPNSQSSQLEEEDLQIKLEAEFVPVNTKKPRVVAPWPVVKCM